MKRSTLVLVESARKAERSLARFQDISAMTPADLKATLGGDPAEAAPWIRSAASHGVVEAQLRLGAMLLDGIGCDRHPASALRWFTRAAQAGNAEAMNMAGRCHENGWGTAADDTAAARWYRRSSEAGHDWGDYNYAHMLFDGRGGISRDEAAAYRLYLRAAEKGHARAMNLVGRCLEAGWGLDRDRQAAANWYARSARAGYFRAQFNHAGMLIEQGEIQEALGWLDQARHHGDAPMRDHVNRLLAGIRDRLAQSETGDIRNIATPAPE